MSTRKPRKKKSEIDLSKLTREQMEFIQARVMQLGSIEAVGYNYRRDDTVSEFAKLFARAYYTQTKEMQ